MGSLLGGFHGNHHRHCPFLTDKASFNPFPTVHHLAHIYSLSHTHTHTHTHTHNNTHYHVDTKHTTNPLHHHISTHLCTHTCTYTHMHIRSYTHHVGVISDPQTVIHSLEERLP